MKTFHWTGVKNEKPTHGSIQAPNIHYARAMLYQQQLHITCIKKQPYFFHRKTTLKLNDEIHLLLQLSSLLKSGINIIDSLQLIINTTKKTTIKTKFHSIISQLQAGKTFSQACQTVFDNMTLAFIHIGEQTGKLDSLLKYSADIKKNQQKHLQDIRSAFFYPAIVSVFALIVTFLLLQFVIPQFSSLFHDFGAQLPLTTRWVMALSEHSISIFTTITLMIILLILIFKRHHAWLFFLLSKLPVINTILLSAETARFSICLDIMIEAGMPIVTALEHTQLIIKLGTLKKNLQKSISALKSGKSLANSLRTTGLPILFIELIEHGEQSGQLSAMLKQISSHFQQQLQAYLSRCQTLLEPIIMLSLGLLIGGLMLAMYLPMFRMGHVL